ncbi:hypothetical protein AB0M02_22700 [Actinoplanes sp. NPDC051861]|uniref:hypothetical protein n=1 Tax=Actinoplanes sp. NPDC051861 TaxID=3155170 RepID=UPI00342D2D46
MSTLSAARSHLEAHLYMDLHPCECGETDFARTAHYGPGPEGRQVEYSGACSGCGRQRSFSFRVSEDVPVLAPSAWSTLAAPSELLDPGEWLWVADRYASYPADDGVLSPLEAAERCTDLAAAAAAVEEALLFVPSGSDAVPVEAIRSERGRSVFDVTPERFTVDQLWVQRDLYRQLAGEPVPRGVPLRARSTAEAVLFMDLRSCVCGDSSFDRDMSWEDDPGHGLRVATYAGPCAGCGTQRAFTFLLPLDEQTPDDAFSTLEDPPSQLLDPGEWWLASVALTELTEAIEEGVDPAVAWVDLDAWEEMTALMARCATACDEVLRFIPDGTGRVPSEAFRTATGRNALRADPAVFDRSALVTARDERARRLADFLARHPEPEDF